MRVNAPIAVEGSPSRTDSKRDPPPVLRSVPATCGWHNS